MLEEDHRLGIFASFTSKHCYPEYIKNSRNRVRKPNNPSFKMPYRPEQRVILFSKQRQQIVVITKHFNHYSYCGCAIYFSVAVVKCPDQKQSRKEKLILALTFSKRCRGVACWQEQASSRSHVHPFTGSKGSEEEVEQSYTRLKVHPQGYNASP